VITTPASRNGNPSFPCDAEYRVAKHVENVIVIGLARDAQLRIIDSSGRFRTVAEARVTLRRAALP